MTDSQRKAREIAEAWAYDEPHWSGATPNRDGLADVIAAALDAARVEERERCAKVADTIGADYRWVLQFEDRAYACEYTAKQIRALSSKAPAPTEGEGER